MNVAQDRTIRSQLERGIDQLRLESRPEAVELLMQYLQLLVDWNTAYNLTAVRRPSEMVNRHLLDSLSLAPWLTDHPGKRFIDVGTGAGLPGMVLAIWFPERDVHLLDSAGKKMRFLFKVKHSLGLRNTQLHESRVEAFTDPVGFDVILTRAYARLDDMILGTRHLLAKGGEFAAMKAQLTEEERNSVPSAYTIASSMPLNVPGEDARRELIIIRPV